MTEALVFLALAVTAIAVCEWLDGAERRDARRRNHARPRR